MAKAVGFTDLHVHAHKDRVDRLHHGLAVLEWTFRTAEEQGCDYVFFFGDLFHERSKIDVMNYLKTFEIFSKYVKKNIFEMYLLVGNHDMYHRERWDINSIKPLTAFNNVHIIDKPTRTMLGGRKIDWMPHTDNPIKALDELKKENGGAGDVLFGHAAVHGAALNIFYGTKADVIVEYDNDMVAVDTSVFADWPMTVLGHYHGAQRLGDNVEYLGSPMELTYGEAFQQKHIMILDLETMKKEYIVNNFSPKHLIVTPQDIRDDNYDFNGNFVRVTNDGVRAKDLVDIKNKLLTDYRVLSYDVKNKERKSEEDRTVIQDAKAILQDTRQMLTTYIKEKGVPPGLSEARLLATGLKCLEKRQA